MLQTFIRDLGLQKDEYPKIGKVLEMGEAGVRNRSVAQLHVLQLLEFLEPGQIAVLDLLVREVHLDDGLIGSVLGPFNLAAQLLDDGKRLLLIRAGGGKTQEQADSSQTRQGSDADHG